MTHPPPENKTEGSKLGMPGRTWKKHDRFALTSFICRALCWDCCRKGCDSSRHSHSPPAHTAHTAPLQATDLFKHLFPSKRNLLFQSSKEPSRLAFAVSRRSYMQDLLEYFFYKRKSYKFSILTLVIASCLQTTSPQLKGSLLCTR